MIFTSDAITSKNHWRMSTRVTQIVIHGKPFITSFLKRLKSSFMPWTHKHTKKNHWSLITRMAKESHFLPCIEASPQFKCDATQTRSNCIMTSYSSIVLARAKWRKVDIRYLLTEVSIDFPPPNIHGVACKRDTHMPIYIYDCMYMYI